MGSVVPLRFRPTIVICVGSEGKAVGASLGVLLANLDAPRREAISFIVARAHPASAAGNTTAGGTTTGDATTGDATASGLEGRWYRPTTEETVGRSTQIDMDDDTDLGEIGVPAALTTLLIYTLRGRYPSATNHGEMPLPGVLDQKIIQRISDDGQVQPQETVTIWIVAPAHSPWLEEAAVSVRDALKIERISARVLLALTNVPPYEPDKQQQQAKACARQPWDRLLVSDNGRPPLATFAYLFEPHDEKQRYWQRPGDVPFAVAEAIFCMTATGMTTSRLYEEMLRRGMPQLIESPFEHMGGVGTSRLIFPRAHAEEYCGARLAADVMHEWARDARDEEVDTREQEDKAGFFRDKIEDSIKNYTRYLRGGRSSPRLSAEGVSAARGQSRRLNADGRLVFFHFRGEQIDRWMGQGRRQRDLPLVLKEQDTKAEAGYVQWRSAVQERWAAYEGEVERELEDMVNEHVLAGPVGVAKAQAFTRVLNEELKDLQQKITQQEEGRLEEHKEFLETMKEKSVGPWKIDIQPRLGNLAQGAAYDTVNGNLPSSGAMATPGGTPDELDMLEGLSARYHYFARRVPGVGPLLGVGLAVITPTVLLIDALLPSTWSANPFTLPLLTVLVMLLYTAGSWAYRNQWCIRRRDVAANDLRKVYMRKYSNRCEEYEFWRRVSLVNRLQTKVRRMVERLTNWGPFVSSLAAQFERDARQIEWDLFEGPIGRRDVFIANRQRLREFKLADFEAQVTERRTHAPLPGFAWHANARSILLQLRNSLRGGVTLVSAQPEQIRGPLRGFCRDIMRQYIVSDVSSLGAALEALPEKEQAGLFSLLVDRSAILYQPGTTPPPAELFIAARDEFRAIISDESLANGAVMLRIQDDEWLATIRLMRGGSVPAFMGAAAQFASAPLQEPMPWIRHALQRGQGSQGGTKDV